MSVVVFSDGEAYGKNKDGIPFRGGERAEEVTV